MAMPPRAATSSSQSPAPVAGREAGSEDLTSDVDETPPLVFGDVVAVVVGALDGSEGADDPGAEVALVGGGAIVVDVVTSQSERGGIAWAQVVVDVVPDVGGGVQPSGRVAVPDTAGPVR